MDGGDRRGLALLVACASGCSTLDRAYKQEVTWTNAPVVQVFTNTVVVTNTVPVVTERTNVVYVTNAATGAVSGYAGARAGGDEHGDCGGDQLRAGVLYERGAGPGDQPGRQA